MASILQGAGSWLLVAGVTVLGFALLIVIHELGHFGVARLCGMRVDRFSVGYGPVLLSRRRGDTEWCLSALPFGGYVKIAGMALGEDVDPKDATAYANQPAGRRFLVILAGPAMNYVAAVALAVGMALSFGVPRADPSPTLGGVLPGGAAERAGLREGDRVLAVDGRPIETWDGLVAEIRSHPGRDIALTVRRAGPGEGAPSLSVTARPDDAGGIGKLGVAQAALADKVGAGGALAAAVRITNAKAGEVLSGLAQVVTRKQQGELMGPIGIAQEMARSARAGPARFFTMVWVISILLALFNLLPIPALDGGRLVFLAYEIATRRRVNQKVENYVHLAGFLALAGLLLAVTLFGDLARIFRR